MNNSIISIEIFGKTYQIKCSESEKHGLEKAAKFVEEKLRALRGSGTILSSDRMAMMAALNLAHELLTFERKTIEETQTTQQRLLNLCEKVESALQVDKQLELQSE